MGINKLIYNGQTKFDLTGDTATAADVLRGKSFHLANGNAAIGTMADYTTFPLQCKKTKTSIISVTSTSKILNLEALDLNGRPLEFLFVTINNASGLSSITTTSKNETYTLVHLCYTRNNLFVNSSGDARQTFFIAAMPMYDSGRARVGVTGTAAAGRFTIENESALASGGAYIQFANDQDIYFRRNCSYMVLMGG